ncbi:uncharacterized protein LOC125704259 [Brienomyrus brachyistius]|uniref:uncharacterized protein LOC125704259 n=1 Tax=Brienomyrus brachyistius TaxID=42636 RepID=UPI0020B2F226|nr:uncharacterized protein LOC125704259 [Brienomyrus brachyistius]
MIRQATIDCSFLPPLPCELPDLAAPARRRRKQGEKRGDALRVFLGAVSISATSLMACREKIVPAVSSAHDNRLPVAASPALGAHLPVAAWPAPAAKAWTPALLPPCDRPRPGLALHIQEGERSLAQGSVPVRPAPWPALGPCGWGLWGACGSSSDDSSATFGPASVDSSVVCGFPRFDSSVTYAWAGCDCAFACRGCCSLLPSASVSFAFLLASSGAPFLPRSCRGFLRLQPQGRLLPLQLPPVACWDSLRLPVSLRPLPPCPLPSCPLRLLLILLFLLHSLLAPSFLPLVFPLCLRFCCLCPCLFFLLLVSCCVGCCLHVCSARLSHSQCPVDVLLLFSRSRVPGLVPRLVFTPLGGEGFCHDPLVQLS